MPNVAACPYHWGGGRALSDNAFIRFCFFVLERHCSLSPCVQRRASCAFFARSVTPAPIVQTVPWTPFTQSAFRSHHVQVSTIKLIFYPIADIGSASFIPGGVAVAFPQGPRHEHLYVLRRSCVSKQGAGSCLCFCFCFFVQDEPRSSSARLPGSPGSLGDPGSRDGRCFET